MIRSLESLYRDFAPRFNEGPNKILSLDEAVKKYVRPGMTLHVMSMHCRPNAILYELFRQSWKIGPGFTLIGIFIIGPAVMFFHIGMVKKVITTFLGDSHPFPGPNAVYQKAFREKKLEIENWSAMSLNQRLMAGAMNLSFFPTRSIRNSTMARDNQENFILLDNPFQPEEKVGVVSPLRPDLSLVHGIAADQYGNTILAPPFGEDVYGALASRYGALVTVEKIVPTDTIRRYSDLVRLPGHLVQAVCEVPLGAHPNGINNLKVAEVENYMDDIDFFIALRNAARYPEKLDSWIKEWVLSCNKQEDYLRKLGKERIFLLKRKTQSDSWKYELNSIRTDSQSELECNPTELMVLVSARIAITKIKKESYHLVLSGAGLSNLSAWMAYYLLKKEEEVFPDLISEWGFGGYTPQPGNPFLFNDANTRTCKFLSDVLVTLGSTLSGYDDNKCLGMLSGAQVDKIGNINSTQIPPDIYITGSGGGNDVVYGAQEVILTLFQSKTRFLEKLPYITSPGEKVTAVISQLGIFEKPIGSRELVLTGYYDAPGGETKDFLIRRIKENCGWKLKISPQVKKIPPRGEEVEVLRMFDPHGYFLRGQG